jgi:hypothetical protein
MGLHGPYHGGARWPGFKTEKAVDHVMRNTYMHLRGTVILRLQGRTPVGIEDRTVPLPRTKRPAVQRQALGFLAEGTNDSEPVSAWHLVSVDAHEDENGSSYMFFHAARPAARGMHFPIRTGPHHLATFLQSVASAILWHPCVPSLFSLFYFLYLSVKIQLPS